MNFHMGTSVTPSAFLQEWTRLGRELGVNLSIQRDDLLPAPLGGNKWIKLLGHVGDGPKTSEVYISNGGIDSNHCRTIAIWAANLGVKAHVVLHGETDCPESGALLSFYARLGCGYEIVHSGQISGAIQRLSDDYLGHGYSPVVVPGGGHSPAGVGAYMRYAAEVIKESDPQYIVHASGTGGTQAGIIAACASLNSRAKVIGISVARSSVPGVQAIADSLSWLDASGNAIDFRDDYIDGGYGKYSVSTNRAVDFAWRHGLPLDRTYTGKAFAGLLDLVQQGEIPPDARVLFWHTGGSLIAYRG